MSIMYIWVYVFLGLIALTIILLLIRIFVPRGILPSTFPTTRILITTFIVELSVGLLVGVPYMLIFLNPPSPAEQKAADEERFLERQTYSELDKIYSPPIGRNLRYLVEDIDAIKHRVDIQRDRVWYVLQTGQVVLIILGALSTAMVAIGNKKPEVAPWVILPTTLVTIISGINAFYDYSGQNSRLNDLRASLSELQGKVMLDVNLGIAKHDDKLAQKEPEEYIQDLHRSLSLVLARYEQGQQIRLPQIEKPSEEGAQ